ncbi:24166_t:CDS:2, partial [Racocetra persica]
VLTEIELFYMLPYQRRKYNWFPNTIFYEVHIHKLRDLIRDIENEKWTTLEKPYISSLLSKIIRQEDKFKTGISKIAESNQITEISQIKKELEDLTSIKKELEDLNIFKKGLEDLTSIKKGLEDLTSLFDNFKNEVITKLNKSELS